MKLIHFIGRTPPIIRSSLFVLLLISLLHQGASAQIPVTGTVVSDDTGEPLAGVSVVIDGTFIGTITDQDGMYAIDLRTQDDVLVFSFVGFRTQRRTVGPGVTSINVRLQLDVVKMEENQRCRRRTKDLCEQRGSCTNDTSAVFSYQCSIDYRQSSWCKCSGR